MPLASSTLILPASSNAKTCGGVNVGVGVAMGEMLTSVNNTGVGEAAGAMVGVATGVVVGTAPKPLSGVAVGRKGGASSPTKGSLAVLTCKMPFANKTPSPTPDPIKRTNNSLVKLIPLY